MFNMFWVELLQAFVMNLEQIEGNRSIDSACTEQVFGAMDHLERGFVEKHDNFNLKDVAIYLLQHTGSLSTPCREKCMSMFCKIAPLVKGSKKDIPAFINTHFCDDHEWICNLYERELIKNPTMENSNTICSTDVLFKYLTSLLCALEGYTFVIRECLIPSHYTSQKSQFISSLEYFLQHIQTCEINDVLSVFGGNEAIPFTATDRQRFNLFKSFISIGIITFISEVLNCDNGVPYITSSYNLLWNTYLWKLTCNCIFNSSALGFYDINDQKIMKMSIDLLNQINDGSREDIKINLANYYIDYINENVPMETTPSNNLDEQSKFMEGLLILQKKSSFSVRRHLHTVANELSGNVYNSLTEEIMGTKTITVLDDNVKNVLELKLEFCLEYEDELCGLITYMCSSNVAKDRSENKNRELGLYLFETFKRPILSRIIDHFQKFIELTHGNVPQSNFVSYTFEVLEYLHEHRRKMGQQLKKTVEICLNKWILFESCFETSTANKQTGADFIYKLSDLYPLYDLIKSYRIIGHWIIGLLTFKDSNWSPDVAIKFFLDVVNLLPCVCGPDEHYEAELK